MKSGNFPHINIWREIVGWSVAEGIVEGCMGAVGSIGNWSYRLSSLLASGWGGWPGAEQVYTIFCVCLLFVFCICLFYNGLSFLFFMCLFCISFFVFVFCICLGNWFYRLSSLVAWGVSWWAGAGQVCIIFCLFVFCICLSFVFCMCLFGNSFFVFVFCLWVG